MISSLKGAAPLEKRRRKLRSYSSTVSDQADQNWWDEEKFLELILDNSVEHGLHCE
jgi:hypothetical protein